MKPELKDAFVAGFVRGCRGDLPDYYVCEQLFEAWYREATYNRIREIRRSKDITQQQLANDLNVSQAFISMIERHERIPDKSLKNLINIRLGTDCFTPPKT